MNANDKHFIQKELTSLRDAKTGNYTLSPDDMDELIKFVENSTLEDKNKELAVMEHKIEVLKNRIVLNEKKIGRQADRLEKLKPIVPRIRQS